jgi:mannitol/fructose-specific phosphotransferase system IIA component (Ntr-type)
VVDLADGTYESIVSRASKLLAERLPVTEEQLIERFLRYNIDHPPVSHGAALPHYRISGLKKGEAELVLIRCRSGIDWVLDSNVTEPIYAFFFLVSPDELPGKHLRVLANLASRIDEEQFLHEWRGAKNAQQLKETLLHHERYLSLHLVAGTRTEAFIGRTVTEAELPARNLIALVRRGGEMHVPTGDFVLEVGDRLTIIGEPAGIRRIYELYGSKG